MWLNKNLNVEHSLACVAGGIFARELEGKEERRTPREEWGGVQLNFGIGIGIGIPRGLRPRGACASAVKETPPATQA